MYFQAIKYRETLLIAGSEFKVVLRRSYKTERQVVLEILIFVSLNDCFLSLNCFKSIAALREH